MLDVPTPKGKPTDGGNELEPTSKELQEMSSHIHRHTCPACKNVHECICEQSDVVSKMCGICEIERGI